MMLILMFRQRAKIIKVMWWSGLNTMQPLCQSATVIKEGDNWIMKG